MPIPRPYYIFFVLTDILLPSTAIPSYLFSADTMILPNFTTDPNGISWPPRPEMRVLLDSVAGWHAALVVLQLRLLYFRGGLTLPWTGGSASEGLEGEGPKEIGVKAEEEGELELAHDEGLDRWHATQMGWLALDGFMLLALLRGLGAEGRLRDVGAWSGKDWGNLGLYAGIGAVRAAFIAGWGVGRGSPRLFKRP
jgi:hypothetical protein